MYSCGSLHVEPNNNIKALARLAREEQEEHEDSETAGRVITLTANDETDVA